MELHSKQKAFVDDILSEVKNSPSSKSPVFEYVMAAPGSGKTTVLVKTAEELSSFFEKNMEYSESNIPKKKVLLLVFDKKMKDEILKRITKSEHINEDIFEVTTVHSLFFREYKNFQKLQSIEEGFELDYTKSYFSKKQIEYFLRSLCKGQAYLGENVDESLEKFRFFKSANIATKENIEALWAMINTYYSTPYSIGMIAEISQDASFFTKKPIDVETSLALQPEDEAALLSIASKQKYKSTPKEMLFRLLIKRINDIANAKEKIVINRETIIEVPMDISDVNGNIVGTNYIQRKKIEKEVEILGNLIKVPHCFYYKSFYTKIVKDNQFTKKVFGDYDIILVDEAQDNDRILFQILTQIAREGIVKNFGFVGDANQSIYAFKSPDHFDMLTHIKRNGQALEDAGIRVKEHDLDITFRFGKNIANFINSLFGTSIEGIGTKGSVDGIYPEQLLMDQIVNLTKNIPLSKNKTVAIVCRSNAEAMKLFVELKSKGCDNVVINSSAKDELKEFFKKGIEVIESEKTKAALTSILQSEIGEKSHYLHTDILSSHEAIRFMAENGMSHLVRFSNEEIERYIMPSHKKRKDIVTIGTSHLFKGAEYDYVVVAGDFFRKTKAEESVLLADEIYKSTPQSLSKKDENFYQSFFGIGNSKDESIHIESPSETTGEVSLQSQLQDPKNHEESCIYYVAGTRAKEMVFFAQTPFWSELSEHISPRQDNSKIVQEVGFLLKEQEIHNEDSLFVTLDTDIFQKALMN